MHTYAQLSLEMFAIEIDDQPASIDLLAPGWHEHDRYGIVLHEPLAAVGASLMTQVFIARFYAYRADQGLDRIPMYPEIYAFHVGGPHGDHSMFDFLPDKEVFMDGDAGAVLHSINAHGITRLVVPETDQARPLFHRAEVSAMLNRVRSAWAYAPGGRVSNADVTIRGLTPVTEENPGRVLRFADDLPTYRAARPDDPRESAEHDAWISRAEQRLDEVPADERDRAIARRREILTDGIATETYRQMPVESALCHLAPA